MSSWNLKELREFVDTNNQDKLALDLIKSVGRAIDIFRYHLHQAKSQNDLTLSTNPRDQMDLVFTPEGKRQEFWERNLAIQANTQACIHSARSIHDLLSQLINCLLFSEPIPVHDCDIHKVTCKLKDSDLKSELSKLLESREFKYINAFVNIIKHRNLVDFGPLISFEDNKSGVQFKSFKFRGEQYESLWAEDVLILSLAVKNTVIAVGCLLNQALLKNNV